MIGTPIESEFYIVALVALIGGVLILKMYKPNTSSLSSVFRIFGIILIIFAIISLSLGAVMLVATNSFHL
jgi:hypothetical protein